MSFFKKAQANTKRKIARATGIPTTKSGRKRKAEKLENKFIGWIVLLVLIGWLLSDK